MGVLTLPGGPCGAGEEVVHVYHSANDTLALLSLNQLPWAWRCVGGRH